MQRTHDLIVFGATGFTGRLAALHLARTAAPSLRWAIGGRSADKLAAVAAELSALRGSPVPVVVGVEAVAASAVAVLSTAGPYLAIGEPMVEACTRLGTHLCDITGEVVFVDAMIAKYSEEARKSGSIVVSMCGYDSVPSEVAVFVAAAEARRLGTSLVRASSYVAMRGSASGGTIASALGMMARPDSWRAADPLLLTRDAASSAASAAALGGASGAAAPARDAAWPAFVPALGAYAVTFAMASINTRVVRRSASLLAAAGAPYAARGTAFAYEEWARSDSWLGPALVSIALGVLRALVRRVPGALALVGALARACVRAPGEGPSDEQRARSWFQLLCIADAADGRRVAVRVAGGDPGYGETARIAVLAATLLATSAARLPAAGGGFYTPAAAFGQRLVDGLMDLNIRVEVAPSVAAGAAALQRGGPPPPPGVPTTWGAP